MHCAPAHFQHVPVSEMGTGGVKPTMQCHIPVSEESSAVQLEVVVPLCLYDSAKDLTGAKNLSLCFEVFHILFLIGKISYPNQLQGAGPRQTRILRRAYFPNELFQAAEQS